MRSVFASLRHPTLSKMSLAYNEPSNWIAYYVSNEFFSTLYVVQFLFLTPWRLIVLALSGNAHIVYSFHLFLDIKKLKNLLCTEENFHIH